MMHLHLYVPALSALARDAEGVLPESLATLLSRARRERLPTTGEDADLAHLFGSAPPLPYAALSHAHDLGSPGETVWLRADPVHLRAERRGLYLFDGDFLDLSRSEAEALIAALDDFFAADGLRLHLGAAQRWYLALPPATEIQTSTLAAVRGADIREYLPRGPNGLYWHRLLNEIQMLLHDHTVNRAREEQNVLTINSLWLWGEGRLVPVLPQRWQQVWHEPEDALGGGLAHLYSTPGILPADAVALLQQAGEADGEFLALLPPKPIGGMAELDSYWFAPLLEALRGSRIDALSLYPGAGRRFTLDPRRARRWWRWPGHKKNLL